MLVPSPATFRFRDERPGQGAPEARMHITPSAHTRLADGSVGRWFRRATEFGLLLVLVALAQWRSWHGTQLDSLTVDEAWHIVAGVEYAREGDFRLNPEHPPLTKRWVGAWMPDSFRLRPKAPLSGKGAERDFVEETLYDDNDFRAAQRSAHAAMPTRYTSTGNTPACATSSSASGRTARAPSTSRGPRWSAASRRTSPDRSRAR